MCARQSAICFCVNEKCVDDPVQCLNPFYYYYQMKERKKNNTYISVPLQGREREKRVLVIWFYYKKKLFFSSDDMKFNLIFFPTLDFLNIPTIVYCARVIFLTVTLQHISHQYLHLFLSLEQTVVK